MPITAIGPSTDGRASWLAAETTTAVAAGASSIDAPASALPERVERDLRISRPTRVGRDGPVRRTAGRTATAAGGVRVVVMGVPFGKPLTGSGMGAPLMPRR